MLFYSYLAKPKNVIQPQIIWRNAAAPASVVFFINARLFMGSYSFLQRYSKTNILKT